MVSNFPYFLKFNEKNYEKFIKRESFHGGAKHGQFLSACELKSFYTLFRFFSVLLRNFFRSRTILNHFFVSAIHNFVFLGWITKNILI